MFRPKALSPFLVAAGLVAGTPAAATGSALPNWPATNPAVAAPGDRFCMGELRRVLEENINVGELALRNNWNNRAVVMMLEETAQDLLAATQNPNVTFFSQPEITIAMHYAGTQEFDDRFGECAAFGRNFFDDLVRRSHPLLQI